MADFSTEIYLKKNCFNLGDKPWREGLKLINKLTWQKTALEGLFVVIVSQNNIK